jgi:predicted DNA-binding transcriptional regulator AlpA
MPSSPIDRLWTVNEVADFLQVSTSWVYKQSSAGLLPSRRLAFHLRFDPDEVRAYARGEWQPASVSTKLVKRA